MENTFSGLIATSFPLQVAQILFRVMSPVFFNTSKYNTLRWVALQLPELKCVATAVSFLSRTSERCMFILFLKESSVSPTYNLLHFEQTIQQITLVESQFCVEFQFDSRQPVRPPWSYHSLQLLVSNIIYSS